MFRITRITFVNFKCFRNFDLDINENINIFVGDNASGKSSILQGIELALCGSVTRVQNLGLENLMNADSIHEFLCEKDIRRLPKLIIEVYLSPEGDPLPPCERFFGEHNTSTKETYGVKLVCEPIEEWMEDLKTFIASDNPVFPSEFYRINHLTFKDEKFNSYSKPIKTIFVDSSEIDSKYVLNNTVRKSYLSSVTENERMKNRQNYKALVSGFQFEGNVRANGICISTELEENLNIEQAGVYIENWSKGEISVIKTNYALNQADKDCSTIFLEEPENHLTHCRMKKMIQEAIITAGSKQFFIATHSSYIATRLGLDNVFFITRDGDPSSLRKLAKETADFFKKAPSNNLLEFILSRKVILVEGAAEYILMEHFYKIQTGLYPESDDVWIISVNGLSFRRFLQVAKLIKNKVAVLRDNDHSKEPKYTEYVDDNIKIFSDSDVNRYTFEVCIYNDNKTICDTVFNAPALDYMLSHKTDAAYKLLLISERPLTIPQYIRDAISWIRK